MPRDFAHKKKTAQQSSVPRWVWAFTFIVASIFIGFLYFLSNQPEEQGGAQAVREQLTAALDDANTAPKKTEKTETPKHETIADIKDKAETMRKAFEFYELLENEEVSIDLPGNEPEKTRTIVTGAGASEAVSNDPSIWIIQVASFKNVADADRVRAQLILNGLPETEIQSVEVSGKGIYHRVVVGPFNHRPSLNKAQDILADLDFQYLVRKRKASNDVGYW